MGSRVARAPALLAACMVLAALTGGCADLAGAARPSCRAEAVGELRCRAIVGDASSRLEQGRPPVVGAAVRLATPADRSTLRAQQLVAIVTFSFLDGSRQEVQVFCMPGRERMAVCTETQR